MTDDAQTPTPADPSKRANRLIEETSPYLLQHAYNPVEWYPWGDEALERAVQEDKPILLSVGYSSCHWCHVMERECFEDPDIAALMNEGFVCIKVDREERPDIDAIYMQATMAMRGQGGWPMTVCLTPDLAPFFAGTYFPPEDRHGMPGFKSVLRAMTQAWSERRQDVARDAARLTAYLRQASAAPPPRSVGAELAEAAAERLSEEFDEVHGGFGSAPKFPRSEGLELLLRHHHRTGDPRALRAVTHSLDCMARGGIFDHIGGGFARYSTDAQWLVPHFEKMLYDNALLTRVYLAAYQVTGSDLYRRVAVETLDYVLREMTSPEGGFYSATDADSEGVEGKFFVWTPDQIQEVVGEERARLVCSYFDVTEHGNWEGVNILHTPRSPTDVAEELGIDQERFQRELAAARGQLYEARARRVPPGLDDKVLTAWNALMLSAFAEGFRVLGDNRYLDAARRAAEFLSTGMFDSEGGLLRSYRAGRARFPAYLEDHAYLADGLIDLYEAGGEPSHLDAAVRLAERIVEQFAPAGDGGAFYFTADGHEDLIVRHREGHDGATPNPNAVAARALARLSFYLDRQDLRSAAVKAIEGYGDTIRRAPQAFCSSLEVTEFLDGPVELAIVGVPGERSFDDLWEELGHHYLPHRILARSEGRDAGDATLPILAGKGLVGGHAAVYVCENYTCQEPATDVPALRAALHGRAAPPSA